MNITKDQIRELSSEQRETLVLSEFQTDRTRRQLLEQASHYSGNWWLHRLVPVMAQVFVLFPSVLPVLLAGRNTSVLLSTICILCPALTLWLLIGYHADHVNRRLDALVELLRADKKGEQP